MSHFPYFTLPQATERNGEQLMTQETYDQLSNDDRRFYWLRPDKLRPTELAARCMVNEGKRNGSRTR